MRSRAAAKAAWEEELYGSELPDVDETQLPAAPSESETAASADDDGDLSPESTTTDPTTSSTAEDGTAAPADDVADPGADEAPQAPATDPASGAQPDPAAPEPDADTPEQAPAAEAAPPEPESVPDEDSVQPFVAKADGREIRVPDATIQRLKDESGKDVEYVVMPRASFDRHLQPFLADRSQWRKQVHEYQQQIAALQPDNHAAVRLADRIASDLDALVEDTAPGWEDRALDYLEKYRGSREDYRRQAEEAARRDQESARGSVLNDEQVEQRIALYETAMTSAVAQEIAANSAFRGLAENEVLEDLADLVKVGGLGALFFEATEDLPEFGLKKGEQGIRLDVIEGRLSRMAERYGRREAAWQAEQQKRAAAENRAKEVEKRNATALQPPSAAPAPARTRTAAPSPAAEPAQKPMSREEWEKDYEETLYARS